ncbi:MAG: hypothetical protein RR598_09625, partial [Anaerorhabdus sp.]
YLAIIARCELPGLTPMTTRFGVPATSHVHASAFIYYHLQKPIATVFFLFFQLSKKQKIWSVLPQILTYYV